MGEPAATDPQPAPSVPNYEIGAVVSSTLHDVTFKGVQMATGTPVLVEMHRARWPTERDLAAKRHAFEVGTSLQGVAGVVEHLDLVETESDLALVTADPGTTPLVEWLADRQSRTLESKLRIAAGLAHTVAQVHAHGIVHNSVAPAWFHVDPDLGTAVISGFARATRLRSEAAEAATHGGSIEYISPEQTGRMNRPVDARSDLYAVGVLIFQILTGELPFKDTDPRAIVHAHIARPAPAITDIDPSIPATINEIVRILLNKNAENRYATARGLAHDLDRALTSMQEDAMVEFPLGEADVADELVLPEALYGRADELAALNAAFGEAASGARRALFVAGYSGIGKSQLVNEIQPSIVARSGWFGGGKFDLYRRDLPYLGWAGAIEDLVRQALTLPEDQLTNLRAVIQQRVGTAAASLIEIVPRLSTLLGDAPPLPQATPAEAQTRITQAFRNLIRSFATPDSPLVLFVDDLQWSDLASLRLLESILEDRATSHLLVLGAWRENEVGPDHPLQATLRRLRESRVSHEVLELGPLEASAVDEYLQDTFHASHESVAELAELVTDKTAGNPFFMRQFLVELERDQFIGFDNDEGKWTWKVAEAAQRQITDNVADLLARRLATLPEPVRHVVSLASCVGPTFDLQSLAGIADMSTRVAAESLNTALAEGLIHPLDDSYRYAAAEALVASTAGDSNVVTTSYAFSHDRIHQAAHESLNPAERAAVHLALARELMSSDGQIDDNDLATASHLGEAMDLLIDRDERVAAAAVLLSAGVRAKASMATVAAAGFLENGLGLLPDDAWERHYALALALHTQVAEVAYIDQRFDDVDRFAPMVLTHARSNLDRVPIHTIRIGVGVSRRAYREATDYAVDVLDSDFGITLPKDPSLAQVMRGVGSVKLVLRNQETGDILELPTMTDPEKVAVMGILMKTATNAYWASPNLVPLIAFEMCRLSVRHGNIGLSAYGYALYGMVASAALGQLNVGYDYGQLAMQLLDATGDTHLVGKTALLWHGFIRHNKDPLRECGPAILEAYDVALDAGDVENAVYCGTVAFFTDVLAGRSLDSMRTRYAGYIDAMLESGQDQTIGALRAWLQCVVNLADPDQVEPRLQGEHVDFTTRLPKLLEAESGTAIPNETSAAGFLAFLLGDLDAAEYYLGLLWERRDDAPGQSFKMPCNALYAVTLIRKRASGNATPRDRLRVMRIQRALAWRAKHNPHDVEPFVAYLEAEALRADDDPASSERFLDAAVLAQERGFRYLEALALEAAAERHGARGLTEIASQIQAKAADRWRRYGALARLRLMGESHVATTVDEEAGTLGTIDTKALLDTVHTISSEIELDRLVERVMTLAIQAGGATDGVLLLSNEGSLDAVASANVDTSGDVSIATAEVASSSYSEGIVEYAVRTGEPVVLDNAATDELFLRDPYVAEHDTHSVLCTPLLRSGDLVGVLYLENQLGVGAFTESHIAMLQALGGQAAVSLENSRLFERQRDLADAFAHFVPRPFLEQLNRTSIVDIALGDAVVADLAVMFSDLRSFTSLSEGLGVDENFSLLNDYLAEMEPPIRRHGGFIDKFIGDSVMALFVGEPQGAVEAAVEMHEALRRFNERGAGPPLQMGIGIHAGSAMLGTVGSPERMETTVIGDTVNTASRLEGMTKPYEARCLISGAVLALLTTPDKLAIREVGRVRVKGKEHPTTMYEVIDARAGGDREAFIDAADLFDEALHAWYLGDFGTSARLFAECHRQVPADLLAESYAQRSAHYDAEGAPPGWEGVDVRTDK